MYPFNLFRSLKTSRGSLGSLHLIPEQTITLIKLLMSSLQFRVIKFQFFILLFFSPTGVAALTRGLLTGVIRFQFVILLISSSTGVTALTTPGPCVDVDQNCNRYAKDTCTNPHYAQWANEQCKKFCGFCSE